MDTQRSIEYRVVKEGLSQIPNSGLDKLHYHLLCKRPVLLTGGIESYNYGINTSTY